MDSLVVVQMEVCLFLVGASLPNFVPQEYVRPSYLVPVGNSYYSFQEGLRNHFHCWVHLLLVTPYRVHARIVLLEHLLLEEHPLPLHLEEEGAVGVGSFLQPVVAASPTAAVAFVVFGYRDYP